MSTDTGLIVPVQSTAHSQMLNITATLTQHVPEGFTGLCHLSCLHTTAGLTINENADPDVVHDLLHELERLVPWRNPAFRHGEGNSAAHLKSSLLGSQLTLSVQNGRLVLGTWQGVYFCEFDGPRSRQVFVHFVAGQGNR